MRAVLNLLQEQEAERVELEKLFNDRWNVVLPDSELLRADLREYGIAITKFGERIDPRHLFIEHPKLH